MSRRRLWNSRRELPRTGTCLLELMQIRRRWWPEAEVDSYTSRRNLGRPMDGQILSWVILV